MVEAEGEVVEGGEEEREWVGGWIMIHELMGT